MLVARAARFPLNLKPLKDFLYIFGILRLEIYFLGSGPKGSMTYAFKHMGNFFLLLLLLLLLRPPPPQILVSRPKSQS